jgi:hypothetical protein
VGGEDVRGWVRHETWWGSMAGDFVKECEETWGVGAYEEVVPCAVGALVEASQERIPTEGRDYRDQDTEARL